MEVGMAYNGSRIKEVMKIPNLKMRKAFSLFLLIRCYLSVFFNSIFSKHGIFQGGFAPPHYYATDNVAADAAGIKNVRTQ